MARINYFAIQEAIQTVLKADNDLSDVTIVVEDDTVLLEQTPWIGIFMTGRTKDGESIAAGRRQHMTVSFELWCVAHHPEFVRQAAELRDDLIGKVELALMRNRSLGLALECGVAVEITSGEFESAKSQSGFMMAGSIILSVIATASV